jgi:hypothetical protein
MLRRGERCGGIVATGGARVRTWILSKSEGARDQEHGRTPLESAGLS